MKADYRGHKIEVTREKCLGGWTLLYFSVFRKLDGYEVISSFEDSAETIRDKIKQLKDEIDDRIAHPEEWVATDE